MPADAAFGRARNIAGVYPDGYRWHMGLNIKNPEVERLAAQVAKMTGESRIEAIRKALEERGERLELQGKDPSGGLRRFLETEVWPTVPKDVFGKAVTKQEVGEILGFGQEGR